MATGDATTGEPVKRGTADPPGYTPVVAGRDSHDVLGVARGASQATIKAAWRKLARAHHPDVAGADPAASKAATRRMAEINRAYEELRVGVPGVSRGGDGTEPGRRAAGPPKPRAGRPVTGRVDTSKTFRAGNSTMGPKAYPPGQDPLRVERIDPEPPRASQPTGPMARGRDPHFRPAPTPSVEVASAHEITFGKFHGHVLGEIAAFEPSYIDWLARTISHDPELVAAARALQAELDRRGIARRPRPLPER